MRPAQEMNMEFVNALNAAESECAKLRRMLEEEQKLVQRLEQEKEDEVQMANIKIERMSQQLAEARKDVEFATVRADVAEIEWIKVKRELQEAQVLVQLLKLENEKKRQSTLKQVEGKELELANALNAAAISESECDKLRTMLGKEQKLVQRHKLEKDDEAQAQLEKRRIEDVSLELVEVQKNAKYETTRADLAENEWIKTKRELQKERELLQLLKPEYDEIRRSAMRQVEEKELELANLLNASETAEIEWIQVKKELQEKLEHVQLLKQECQETRQSAMRQVEEKELEFADALNALNVAAAAASSSAAAEGECAKLRRMLIEEGKTVQRLILEKDLVVKLAQRQIEETRQELANVLNVTTTTESSSTAEGFAATNVFATFTHSQSTPFGSSASSPLFGSSGNTTISSGSSMLPSISVANVFNSASNTCSSHCGAMSSIFGFSSWQNKSSSPFAASTVCPPMFGSSSPFARTTASQTCSPSMFGSASPFAASTASPSVFGSPSPFAASTASQSVFGSSSPFARTTASQTCSPSVFGSSSPFASPSVFGSPSPFAASTASQSEFGSFSPFARMTASQTCSPSVFGSSSPFASPSVFGSPSPFAASTASQSEFGSSSPFARTTASQTCSPSMFGSASPFAASTASPSVFGSPSPFAASTASQSVFGSSSPFARTTASQTCSPSVFGSSSPFASPSVFGSPSPLFSFASENDDNLGHV